jgi:hypothetical protein
MYHSPTQTSIHEINNSAMTSSISKLQKRLEELLEYKSNTEQKILEFDQLIMTTLYRDKISPTSSSIKTKEIISKRNNNHDEIKEDENNIYANLDNIELTPSSPVFRMHREALSIRKSMQTAQTSEFTATNEAETGIETRTPVSNEATTQQREDSDMISTTASGDLLNGMLSDFHKVLKEHRRLKRLCSSQQMCIMALR